MTISNLFNFRNETMHKNLTIALMLRVSKSNRLHVKSMKKNKVEMKEEEEKISISRLDVISDRLL